MKTFELVKQPLAEKAPTQAADDDLVGSGEVEQGRVLPADGDQRHLAGPFLRPGQHGPVRASPCTDWLGDTVACDEHGFVLTGARAGADGLLETSVPGVYAAGDARSGSIKRCATAVGEGATVVSLIHGHLAAARL